MCARALNRGSGGCIGVGPQQKKSGEGSGERCTIFLHHFSEDWDGRVDRVADDVDNGIWADLCNTATPASQYQSTQGRLADPSARVATMPALMANRSSRVMPGFLGTPAGMTTRSHPASASKRWSCAISVSNHGSVVVFRNLVESCDAGWG